MSIGNICWDDVCVYNGCNVVPDRCLVGMSLVLQEQSSDMPQELLFIKSIAIVKPKSGSRSRMNPPTTKE